MDSDEETFDGVTFDVSVLDLLNFGGPNMMRQGDQVYQSDHLMQFDVSSVGHSICKIQAICLQTSHPTENPHVITITTGSKFDLWKFHCSCKAGAGSRSTDDDFDVKSKYLAQNKDKFLSYSDFIYKNIYATLLHIHTHRKLKVLSCTEVGQKWGKIAKEKGEHILEPVRIRDLPEFKNFVESTPTYMITEEEFNYFEDELFSEPKTTIAAFVKRSNAHSMDVEVAPPVNSNYAFSSTENDIKIYLTRVFKEVNFGLRDFIFQGLTANVVEFYRKRVCLSTEDSIDINLQTRDQNNQTWKYERKLRITASECYTLFTALNNPLTDWSKKVEYYFKKKPNFKNLQIGRREEPNALRCYEIEKNFTLTKFGLIINPSCPWLACSPDSLSITSDTVIEVKTLMNAENEDFETVLKNTAFLRKDGDFYVLRQKHKHYGQAQINMFLLNVRKCDLVVYNYKSQEIRIVKVSYNEAFIQDIVSSLCYIYFKYVLKYVFEKFVTEKDKKLYG